MNKFYEIVGRIALIALGIAISFILIQKAIIYIEQKEDSKPLPAGQIEIQFKIDEINRQQERQKRLDDYSEMTYEDKIKYEMENR